jgi:cytochrome c556
MRRLGSRAVGLGAGVAAIALAALVAEGEQGPSINAVMHKQYTASSSAFIRIRKELKSNAPNWEKIQESTRKFLELEKVLEQRDPPRGDRESWMRYLKLHLEDAKALDAAARAKDKDALRAARERVNESCKGCHDAHKFRKDP